ncbi:MAG: hypothetical protein WB711_04150 [Terriglobales bacterium]
MRKKGNAAGQIFSAPGVRFSVSGTWGDDQFRAMALKPSAGISMTEIETTIHHSNVLAGVASCFTLTRTGIERTMAAVFGAKGI